RGLGRDKPVKAEDQASFVVVNLDSDEEKEKEIASLKASDGDKFAWMKVSGERTTKKQRDALYRIKKATEETATATAGLSSSLRYTDFQAMKNLGRYKINKVGSRRSLMLDQSQGTDEEEEAEKLLTILDAEAAPGADGVVEDEDD